MNVKDKNKLLDQLVRSAYLEMKYITQMKIKLEEINFWDQKQNLKQRIRLSESLYSGILNVIDTITKR